MNPRLIAALQVLDQCTASLQASNIRYREANNRFRAWVNRWTDKNGNAPAEWQPDESRLAVKNYR